MGNTYIAETCCIYRKHARNFEGFIIALRKMVLEANRYAKYPSESYSLHISKYRGNAWVNLLGTTRISCVAYRVFPAVLFFGIKTKNRYLPMNIILFRTLRPAKDTWIRFFVSKRLRKVNTENTLASCKTVWEPPPKEGLNSSKQILRFVRRFVIQRKRMELE